MQEQHCWKQRGILQPYSLILSLLLTHSLELVSNKRNTEKHP